MIIDCISDLHGHYPKLEGGDLLIVAGDLTAKDTSEEELKFLIWLQSVNYEKKIVIAGNHDNRFVIDPCFGCAPIGFKFISKEIDSRIEYLCDSGTEFEGLKIWGSPWTKRFEGMNPKCMAFTVDTDEELAKKWDLIPEDTNILITHCPPYGILDEVKNYMEGKIKNVGSMSLRNVVLSYDRIPHLKLHVFGHIHEWGGKDYSLITTKYVNASHVNENYQPVNKPVRIEL